MDIHLIGASGKLGMAIQKQLPHYPCTLKGAYVSASSSSIECETLHPPLCYSPFCTGISGVCIDVSSAKALKEHFPIHMKNKNPLVVGSTGHSKEILEQLKQASVHFPILYASNFSFGVFLFSKALEALAPYRHHIPDIELTETHHIHKKDAPSGTALSLANILPPTHSINSIRKDDTPGIHTTNFFLGEETFSLSHTAHSRKVFAEGAIKSALFLSKQSAGWYTMSDFFKEK